MANDININVHGWLWFGRLRHISAFLLAGADGFVLRMVHSRWQIFTTCTNIVESKKTKKSAHIEPSGWSRRWQSKLSDTPVRLFVNYINCRFRFFLLLLCSRWLEIHHYLSYTVTRLLCGAIEDKRAKPTNKQAKKQSSANHICWCYVYIHADS